MHLLKCCAVAVLTLTNMRNTPPPPDPVHFTFAATPVANSSNTFDIHCSAKMDHGWHIYAMQQPADAIGVPTAMSFSKNPLITLKGQPKEIGEKETYTDLAAGITQYQYGGEVDIIQTVQVKGKAKTNCAGTVTYQACTEEMCLPPKTITFSVPLP